MEPQEIVDYVYMFYVKDKLRTNIPVMEFVESLATEGGREGLVNYNCEPNMVFHLFLKIKFYWKITKSIHLHTACGWFPLAIADSSYCDNTTCHRMYKIFTILFITEKKNICNLQVKVYNDLFILWFSDVYFLFYNN